MRAICRLRRIVFTVYSGRRNNRSGRSRHTFVSPALGGESFGMVLVESFATATPVVASDIPGFAAIAPGDAAVLVPPGDIRALTDAVVDVLEDEPTRVEMGRAGRALVEDLYAWGDVARRLEEIYERVSA